MTTLYLYRHGETEENRRHILQGHMPGNLTTEGRRQIAESVTEISQLRLDRIVCSDLQRCRQTAEILNRVLRLPTEYTDLLRERDWGSATGMIVDGVTRIRIPDDAETVPAMRRRALRFMQEMSEKYPAEHILVVSHGLFCRQIQAAHQGVEIADIVPMKNTEVRVVELK